MSDQGLLNKLEQISFKYDEIAKQMVDPDIISDMKRYVNLNREYKELSEIVKVYHSYRDVLTNIENAKKFVKNNKEFVKFAIDDSLNFLSSFEKKIDFLYLDSLDGQYDGASKHQLEEIKIAKEKLNKNSLVLLDDKGSKTNLSIDFMLNNSFRIINETKEQVLLSYL